MDLNVAVKTGY